jgi:spore coat protein U-like protein
MGVTALVLSTCIVVATPVSFGNYSLSVLDASGLVTVTCTPDVSAYTVALDAGTGAGATTTVRKMTALAGTDTLSYSLFRDTGRTQNWGDTVGELQPSSAATTTIGTIKTFAVYGRLTANQSATVGAYLDTIQVTVTY